MVMSENIAEDDWESNFTDDGECVNEEMLSELSLIEKGSTTEKLDEINYLEFKPKEIDLDVGEFGHVLELFDFPSNLKTHDLYNALTSIGIKDYNITWVDDTHALAAFASRRAAHTALKGSSPIFKMRQVINGTEQSKLKANNLKDVLLPYKKRPQTSSLVARNLVTGALGIKSQVDVEQRKKERDVLKKAREEKKLKAKLKKDIWENP